MCTDMFLYINVYMFVHVEVREKLGSLFYFGAFHLVFKDVVLNWPHTYKDG